MRHDTDLCNTSNNRSFVQRMPTWLRVSALILALTPLQGFSEASSAEAESRFERIMHQKVIKVASVAGDSTYFKKDAFFHGFGYDLVHAYSDDLDIKLEFKVFSSTKAALKAVKAGKVDLAMTTASHDTLAEQGVATLDITCGENQVLGKNGLNKNLNWAFKDDQDPLIGSANNFVCQQKHLGMTARLAGFYDQNMMRNTVERSAFKSALNNRLPQYLDSFQANAKQHRLDWQLLAAMGYQESHLKADAVSPTGVKGLMMLTQGTARGLGVVDREDPVQSIEGGAKYFGQLLGQYNEVAKADRAWFALVAYNMGPGALEIARQKAKAYGLDPNNWTDVFDYLSDNSAKNASYRQAVHYVTRIRAYVETLKQDGKLSKL